ncbi:MAG: ornithine cyclodeaminase family protein [Actinomycetota bacterium]
MTAPLDTLVLGAADVAAIVDQVGRDELIDLMIARLRARCAEHSAGTTEVRARDGFRYDKPDLGLVEWMPTHEAGGPVVVKMVGYHPANPVQRDLPSVIATSSMWDTDTGHLVALADATLLTALRTGAASALATDVLANDGPITLGIVGLGAQAVTQLHAISRVRSIERVIALDTDLDVAASFPQRVAFCGVPVEVAEPERADTIAAEVDVLCTCTSVDLDAGPVIGDTTPRPGLHVNAVGADFPGKLELPGALLSDAFVVPDIVDQCVLEGECQQVPRERIGPPLAEIVRDQPEHRSRRNDVTVFDSTGWAVEDDVALRLLVECAQERGIGRRIPIEYLPTDPYDPYAPPR